MFYFRFALSFRDVEEMLATRGVAVSYRQSAHGVSSSVRLTPMAYVTSVPHLGEVFLNINCRVPYLWRTVDQDGEVLDIWSKATEIGSCQEVLSQIIKGIAVCPACDHHR